jgi:aspartate aminotransferase-like enzyme
LRNGWFSYRWTQIFDLANITQNITVIKGKQLEDSVQGVFAPAPIEEVVAFIKKEKPAVVFAPHVETSAGIILPDDYLKAVGEAVRSVNGLFVLDCIASGAMWVDMKACNVDVVITAPQKGWSSSPCCALIAMGDRARERIESTQSSSFSMDLKKWLQIMEAYEKGGHVYHTTMPTDALKILRNVMKETQALGFAALKEKQQELVRIQQAARYGKSIGLKVNAGHGLHEGNVAPIASILEIAELNIGHAIVAEALFKGWQSAIQDMRALMLEARQQALKNANN